MLFYYRGRCVSLLGRRWGGHRHGNRYLDHLRRRRIESLDDPVDGEMSKDNGDKCACDQCKKFLYLHLFRYHLL
jgi:hypothetical protein